MRKKSKHLSELILPWYEKHGRDLPWRKSKDPYKIWISEIMLQQTQVSRVREYYERFLGRFPSIKSLSEAKWRELLPYWRGLGYYQRGRNLLRSAVEIQENHGGKFPTEVAELKKLPGIGPYTASAIASFAFGFPTPAIDTNIKRVIQRFWGEEFLDAQKKIQQEFEKNSQYSADLNHALMDVGALFCRSRVVDCEHCPLSTSCSFALDHPAPRIIVDKPKEKRKKIDIDIDIDIDVGAACIHRDGQYLIAQSSSGLWEFPGGKRESGEDIRACLKREIREELGLEISVRPSFLKVDFEKGGKSYRLHFCRCQILRGQPKRKVHKQIAWIGKGDFADFRFRETNMGAVERLAGKR